MVLVADQQAPVNFYHSNLEITLTPMQPKTLTKLFSIYQNPYPRTTEHAYEIITYKLSLQKMTCILQRQ